MLALLLLLVAALAAPVRLEMAWDLTVDGKPVGSRELIIRPSPDGGDARILTSWTELRLDVGGVPFHLQQRVTGLGEDGPIPFASVVGDNGHPREVQVVRHGSEWMVTLAEDGQARRYRLPGDAFDFTSLNLVDPASWSRIAERSYLRVVLAETGRIVEGPFRRVGPVAVLVGGETVQGQAYTWSLPDGEMHLVVDDAGHLLEVRQAIAGAEVVGRLRALPAEEPWEEPLPAPLVTGPIAEESL